MGPTKSVVQTLLKHVNTITSLNCKLDLLKSVVKDNKLLRTNLISSIKPKVGKKYIYPDLQNNADNILLQCRQRLCKVSITEIQRDVRANKTLLTSLLEELKEMPGVDMQNIRDLMKSEENNVISTKSNKHKTKQKINLDKLSPDEFKTPHESLVKSKTRCEKRLKSTKRRQTMRKNYQRNLKIKKQTDLALRIKEIKDSNVVINLSNKDIPDEAYIYLSHGLNFVPSKPASKEDIKFDLTQFLRKLSWKAFFHANPNTKFDDTNVTHPHLKVKSNKWPNFTTPLLEEVKSKELGYANNIEPKKPKDNLPPRALRGRKWLTNAIEKEEIFISEADKGGAILILNHEDVTNTLERELQNPENYELISQDPSAHLKTITSKIQSLSCKLEVEGCITANNRETITGLNDEMNLKHSPEYRAIDPTIYPSFKVHKLTEQEIADKVVPPARFINNAKFGPLYRVEKWCSTHLTSVNNFVRTNMLRILMTSKNK